MTQNNLLDSILSSYLYGQILKAEKPHQYKKLTFEFIAKTQEPGIEDWRIEFAKKNSF